MDALFPVFVDGAPVAVMVQEPEVLKVPEKLRAPATRLSGPLFVNVTSVDVSVTVSVTDVTRLKNASTALTVIEKATVFVSFAGVPVLPVGVPGAAVSPGTRTCSCEYVLGLTVTVALVPVLLEGLPVAVTV